MSPNDIPEQLEQLLFEAFNGGPGSPEERRLKDFLQEHPQWEGEWQTYLSLRRGLNHLQEISAPSRTTRLKILASARQNIQPSLPARKGWRWFFSQPVVAVATVLLVIGVGIYSRHVLKETGKGPESRTQLKSRETTETTQFKPAQPRLQAVPAKKKISPLPAPPTTETDFPLKAMAPPPPSPPRPAPEVKALAPSPSGGAGLPTDGSQAPSPPNYQGLLAQAKTHIKQGDCATALNLLREARGLQDTAEVRQLIFRCEKAK